MSKTVEKVKPSKIPDIRITDEVLKKMVAEEQHRLGDPNATKTAGRIIERYFASRGATTPALATG